jgi:hypothetical protein
MRYWESLKMPKPLSLQTIAGMCSFADMGRLGNFEEKRGALLARVDEIYAIAQKRGRITAKGDEILDPDCHSMVKCVEVGAKLLGVMAEAEAKAKKDSGAEPVPIVALIEMFEAAGYEVKKKAA